MTYHTRIAETGELILSADIARAIGLAPGDAISVEPGDRGATIQRMAAGQSKVHDEVERFIAERADDWDE